MLWNIFTLALCEIRRNLKRSFLTTLGIVISVAAVIVMVAIGGGATVQVAEQIASLGSNLLVITPGKLVGLGQKTAAPAFDLDDVEVLASHISGIVAIAPSSSTSMTAVYGNANWTSKVDGVDNAFFSVGNWVVAVG